MRSWGQRSIALVSAMVGVTVLAPACLAAGSTAGAERVGSASSTQGLRLVLPLRANLAGLERFAAAVSTVGSPQYGDFEPVSVLARRFGASSTNRGRVIRFLRARGASHVRIDATGLFADATLTVRRAERLFGTSLARYESVRAGQFIAPTHEALVPPALRGAVTGVVGLDTLPLVSGQTAMASAARFPHTARFDAANTPSGYGERTGTAAGCSGGVQARGFTPNQYLDAYNYTPLRDAGISGQGERVALIEIDGFRYADVKTFAQCFGLPVPAIEGFGVNITRALPVAGEATLDLEVLDAAAPGLKAVDVYETRARPSDVLEALTAPLQNRGRVPEVISASLGVCEPVLQLAVGTSGIRNAEGALALAAASGISVLASSGDDGSSSCALRGSPIDALAESYPASSPYVTAVGGTNFVLNSANQLQSETVWNDAPYDVTAGGGGSSILFGRPSYQNGVYRRNRRAVPDVSMLADVLPGYNIYCSSAACNSFGSGPWVSVGGTSAASPLLAGGLALVDQMARENGKQELGLANSLFYKVARHYSSAGVFYDVRTGNNDLGPYIPGGNHRPLGCCTAGPGFDRASGLGSVDLAQLALLAVRLQPGVASPGISMPRQRPIARHHLIVRLSCSRRCNAQATASIALPGAATIVVRSPVVLFLRRGRHQVLLKLSGAQLGGLRSALHHGQAVVAQVTGEVLDSGGNIERVSGAQRLRIRN